MPDSQEFAQKMWSQLPDVVCQHVDEGQYRAWVQGWVERVGDETWAKRGLEKVGRAGATLDDYHERLLTVSDAAYVAGIRFYGGKSGPAFIDVNLHELPVAEVPWERIAAEARKAYGVFEPGRLRRVRWLRDEPAEAQVGWELDQLLLAAPLANCVPSGAPVPDTVNVGKDDVGRVADAIAAMYDAWYGLEPWMRGRVTPQTSKSLEQAVEEGAAVAMRAGRKIVGVASAIPQAEFRTGCGGLCVYEKVVCPAVAGTGLSHVLHGELVRSLAASFDNQTLLYGTVDAHNVRSIRNAERVGRKALAVLEFMPLDAS